MRKLSTHTARANSTILMHRLCRGFPTSHSRATVSSIYSRIFTAQAVKVSRDTHGSIPEPHKHQNLRVHLAKMVAADMLSNFAFDSSLGSLTLAVTITPVTV